MIRAQGLTKRYGRHVAIDNLDFNIDKGEILGFLGPNGAGKSTTMNIITGYLSASEGSITVDGVDILERPEEVKRNIGYLPEQPPLYFEMTVLEYLDFVGQIKKVPKAQMKLDMEKIMDLVKIQDVQKRLIRNLSKGYKQRVGLAQALIGNPKLLILDEPTVGLDPKQIIEIRNLIKDLRADHTIVLSSHILPEVAAVCERVLIIDKGSIVASDTPENLSKRLVGSNRLALRAKGTETAVVKAIENIGGVKSISVQTPQEEGACDVLIEAARDTDIRTDIFNALSGASAPILLMRPMDLSLEDIFLKLTTSEQEVDQ